MRIFLILLLFVHGLIHLMGFAKAFSPAAIPALTKEITKPAAILWLTAAVLFLITALLYLLNKTAWWIPAVAGILLSQLLIITVWKDARWGTVANLLILLAAVTGFAAWQFECSYKKDIALARQLQPSAPASLLTEADLQKLPLPVQRYLSYCGCPGKPKVKSFRISFTGSIRQDEHSPWMPFTSEQYNFIEQPSRFFFMKAVMKKLPVAGYHHYRNGKAVMDIRLLSLFKVQYQEGSQMNESETVTFFNDMCCLAPATLIDKRITWLRTDEDTVQARFTNGSISIEATLYFNKAGQLVNFISHNRYAQQKDGSMKQLPWSTPLKEYREVSGIRLAGYADAVYEYKTGPVVYGRFSITGAMYNP